ncbi:MAG TPA: methyltransferase domain-containing protein [Terriglobia bacterium]|nr:methyltransferase domain-containing protein [Terriglobia bacterium]
MSTQWNARLYDAKHAFVWERATDLLQLLEPGANERILDLGCGTGHLAAKIASSCSLVIGIDSSPAMIAEAKQNYPALAFEVADARDFQFGDPFDAVFSNAALHWIKPPERVVECVRNALKPGGRFVAEFGGKGNVRYLVDAFSRSLELIGCAPKEDPNPWYFPSVGEYSALLEQRGFEVAYAALFDRPTPLEDGEHGIRNWIRMFGGAFSSHVLPEKGDAFIEDVERQLRSRLFRDGAWYADYRRLRIGARKL